MKLKDLLRTQEQLDSLYDQNVRENIIDEGYTYDKQLAILIKQIQFISNGNLTDEFKALVDSLNSIKKEANNNEIHNTDNNSTFD